MNNNFLKISLPFALTFLVGCSTFSDSDVVPDRNMDKIYEKVSRTGKRDTVNVLREGLRMNYKGGQQDPFIPIRNPALVVPVWLPTQTHPKSGERISGHWKWLEVEEESWSN